MRKLTTIIVACAAFCALTFAGAQTKSHYELGHDALLNYNIPLAKAMFEKALLDEPNSSSAKVMAAITKVIAPFQNESFIYLIRSIGFPVYNDNLFNLYVGEVSSIEDISKTWRTKEDIDYLKNAVLPELLEALKLVEDIDSSMKKMVIHTKEISILGFDLYESEILYIDYADVEFIKGLANLATGAIYFATSYNLDVKPSLLIETYNDLSAQMALGAFPELATFEEKENLAKAKAHFKTACTLLKNAINNLADRKSGSSYVFAVSKEEATPALDYIDKFAASLNATVSLDTSKYLNYNLDLNLAPIFAGNIDREDLPNLIKNRVIWDSVKDFTLSGVFPNMSKDIIEGFVEEGIIKEKYFNKYVTERNKLETAIQYPLMRYGITGVEQASYDESTDRYVFETKASYSSEDTNGLSDVYMLDGKTGAITLVSKGLSAGASLCKPGLLYDEDSKQNKNAIGGDYVVFTSRDSSIVGSEIATESANIANLPIVFDLYNNKTDERRDYIELPISFPRTLKGKYAEKVKVEIDYSEIEGKNNPYFDYYWNYVYIDRCQLLDANGNTMDFYLYDGEYCDRTIDFQPTKIRLYLYSEGNVKIRINKCKVSFVPEKRVVLANVKTGEIKKFLDYIDAVISPNGKYLVLSDGNEWYDKYYDYYCQKLYDIEKNKEYELPKNDWGYNNYNEAFFSGDSKRLFFDGGYCYQDIQNIINGDKVNSIDVNGDFAGIDYYGHKILVLRRDIEYAWDEWHCYYTFNAILRDLDRGTEKEIKFRNPYFIGNEYCPVAFLSPDGYNIIFMSDDINRASRIWYNYDISTGKTTKIAEYAMDNLDDYPKHFQLYPTSKASNFLIFGNTHRFFDSAPASSGATFAQIDVAAEKSAPAYISSKAVAIKQNAQSASVEFANGNGRAYKLLVRDLENAASKKIYDKNLSGSSSKESLALPNSSAQVYAVDLLATSLKTPVGASPTVYVGRELTSSISILDYPKDAVVKKGESASFSVSAKAGSGTLSYKWEKSTDGNTWASTNSSENSISVNNIKESDSGAIYRCKISDSKETKYVGAKLIVEDVAKEYSIIGNYEDVPMFNGDGEVNQILIRTDAPDNAYVNWQMLVDGKWIDINNNYEDWGMGVINGSLFVRAFVYNSGNQYRAVIETEDGKIVYTEPTKLTVDTSKRTFYVSPSGNDNNNGKSWSSAFKTIDRAMEECENDSGYGGVVMLKSGTYQWGERSPNNVSIYGGFNGTEKTLEERKLDSKNPTIIILGENGYHICGNLNGIHFKTNATECSFIDRGEGNLADLISVENCTFENISFEAFNSSLLIKDCTISGFKSSESSNFLDVSASYFAMKNCTIANNRTMFNEDNKPVHISSNYDDYESVVDIYNCTFYNNVITNEWEDSYYEEDAKAILYVSPRYKTNIVNSIFWNDKGQPAAIDVGYNDDDYRDYWEYWITPANVSSCIIQNTENLEWYYGEYWDYETDKYYEDYKFEVEGVMLVDVISANPQLDVLADNGGYVKTIAVDKNSPAIGMAISPLEGNPVGLSVPYYDARGNERNLYMSTIGAYEYPVGIVLLKDLEKTTKCTAGDDITLSINAKNFENKPQKYVWYVNKQDGKGFVNVGSNAELTIKNINVKMNGWQYKCTVSTSDESKTSTTTALFVEGYPLIESIQMNKTSDGKSVEFEIIAYGNNLQYQWYENNGSGWRKITNNESSKTNKLLIENIADSSIYKCNISSGEYSIETNEVSVGIVIMEDLEDETECNAGKDITLKVYANNFNGKALKYAWRVDKQDGKGFVAIGNKEELAVKKPTVKMNGWQYKCLVSDDKETKSSAVTTLRVNGKPIIGVSPKGKTTFETKNVEFEVVAYGNNLKYQWYKKIGKTLEKITDNASAKTSKLILENVDESAQYVCMISSGQYEVLSSAAKLTLKGAAKITGWSVIQNKDECDFEGGAYIAYSEYPLDLSVIATGASLVYQWYECSSMNDKGIPIAKGGTSKKLSFKKLEYDKDNVVRYYRCEVKNGTKKLGYADGTSSNMYFCVRVEKCPMPENLAGKGLFITTRNLDGYWNEENSFISISQDKKQIRIVKFNTEEIFDALTSSTYSYKRKGPTSADISLQYTREKDLDNKRAVEKGSYKGVLNYEDGIILGTLKSKNGEFDLEISLYEETKSYAPKALTLGTGIRFYDVDAVSGIDFDIGNISIASEWANLFMMNNKKCIVDIMNGSYELSCKYVQKTDKVAVLTFSYKIDKTTIAEEVTMFFDDENGKPNGWYIRKTKEGKLFEDVKLGVFEMYR